MSSFFTIQCNCGYSWSIKKLSLRNNPSGTMKCKGLNRDGKVCGRLYDNTEMIRHMDGGVEVYYAMPFQAQITMGEQR